MMLPRRRFLRLAGTTAAVLAAPRVGRAQSYPTRSVRMIVPFAPGGPTDLFARMIAPKLSEQMGQQFYIENVGRRGRQYRRRPRRAGGARRLHAPGRRGQLRGQLGALRVGPVRSV